MHWRKNSKAKIEAAKPFFTDDHLRIRNKELEKKISELQRAYDILKDALVFFKRPEEVKTSERYLFVMQFKNRYTVMELCKALKISESGYYRRLKNRTKQIARQLLTVKIKEISAEHPDNSEVQEKENLIKRDFKADKPLKILLADITEVQCVKT